MTSNALSPAIRAAAPLAILFMLSLPMQSSAQTTPAAPSAAEAALRKPTDFRSRAELRNEYQDIGENGDGYRNIIVPRFEYAVSPSVGLRLEMPYSTNAPHVPGFDSVSGHGDLLLRAAWRAVQRDGFALILGTELILDTADDDRLGSGKNIVGPLAYAAIDLPRHDSVFFPYVQHYVSVSGDGNRDDVSVTTVKPNLLTRWPNRVYTFLEPQFLIDWERDAKVGLTVELEVGKIISQNMAAWLRPGVGLINRNELMQVYNWNFEVGMRYIF